MNPSRFETLVSAAYEAAFDPALWRPALLQVLDAVGGTGIRLHGIGRDGAPQVVVDAGMPKDAIAEYDRDHIARCPRIAYGLAHPRECLVYDSMILTEREMDRDATYAFFERSAGVRYFIAAQVRNDADGVAWLSVQRPRRMGHVGRREIELMRRISPHVERALCIGARLDSQRRKVTSLEDALDRSEEAMLTMRADGTVAFANGRARAILAEADGIRWLGRRIGYVDGVNGKETLMEPLPGHADRRLVRRPSGRRGYVLRIVSPRGADRPLAVPGAGATAVFIRDPESAPSLECSERLASALGLTVAQARLAILLARGADLQGAARELCISLGTARAHLEQAFARAGVRRQHALVRRVLGVLEGGG